MDVWPLACESIDADSDFVAWPLPDLKRPFVVEGAMMVGCRVSTCEVEWGRV